MHLQWVSLLFAISPLRFLFFLQKQKKEIKKKQETKEKNNKLHLTPPLGVCNLVFFVIFLVSWCFAFLVRCYFEGLAKKVAGSNSLPLFPP